MSESPKHLVSKNTIPTTDAAVSNVTVKQESSILEPQKTIKVEKILKKSVDEERNVAYFVKWKGFAERQNSWIIAAKINSVSLINAFEIGDSSDHVTSEPREETDKESEIGKALVFYNDHKTVIQLKERPAKSATTPSNINVSQNLENSP